METQISKPEDFEDKNWFHKHMLLSALFFTLLVLGVAAAIYFGPFKNEAKAPTQDQPANNGSMNACLAGSTDCNDIPNEKAMPASFSSQSDNFEIVFPYGMEVEEGPSNYPGFETGKQYVISYPGQKWSYAIHIKPQTTAVSAHGTYIATKNYWVNSNSFSESDFTESAVTYGGVLGYRVSINNFEDNGGEMFFANHKNKVYMIVGSETEFEDFILNFRFN